MNPQECLETRPKSVAIVAMGASNIDFFTMHADKRTATPQWEEVWAVNTMWRTIRCDKAFMMDDLKQYTARNYPHYAEILKGYREAPIITTRAYPEWPMSVAYPLESVVSELNDTYLTNTVPYALAYAISIGVEKVILFGCDYWYEPGMVVRTGLAELKAGTLSEDAYVAKVTAAAAAERGKDNLEYLMGIGRARGMQIGYTGRSTLCDSVYRNSADPDLQRRYLYGYEPKPTFGRDKATNRLFIRSWGDASGNTDSHGDGQHAGAPA